MKQKANAAAMPRARQSICRLSWDGHSVVYLDVRALPNLVFGRASIVAEIIDAIVAQRVTSRGTLDIFGGFGVAFARRDMAIGASSLAVIDQIRTLCEPNLAHSAIDRVVAAEPGSALIAAQTCLAERCRRDEILANNALSLLTGVSAILADGLSGLVISGGSASNFLAHRAEARLHVFLREGQAPDDAAALSAFHLNQAGRKATLIPDRAAAWLMQNCGIGAVTVGAEAIGADAQAVCPMGTYGIAVAAAHHGIPCYLLAPRAIVDVTLDETQLRTIADRAGGQVAKTDSGANALSVQQSRDAGTIVPFYDRTPGRFFSAIVTEYGITRPPYDESLLDLLSRPNFSFISDS